MGGRWEFPGGKVESGESPEEALGREMLEEFGARASAGIRLCETRFSNKDKEYILIVFEAVLETPILDLKEHEEVRWLPWEDIGGLELADSDRGVYETLTETMSK